MDIMECPEAVVNALGKSNMIGTSSLVYLVPYVWKPIAVLIPLVQWCMLATVIVFTTEQYNSGSCPGNAGVLSKVLMTAISILLFSREMVRLFKFYSVGVKNDDILEDALGLKWQKTLMAPCCFLDTGLKLSFASCVILVNLWVVFVSDSPLDMVLNSVALEFIADLDQYVADQLFEDQKMVNIIWTKLNQNWKEYSAGQPTYWTFLCKIFDIDQTFACSVMQINVIASFFVSPVAALVMAIYGAICKGELASPN